MRGKNYLAINIVSNKGQLISLCLQFICIYFRRKGNHCVKKQGPTLFIRAKGSDRMRNILITLALLLTITTFIGHVGEQQKLSKKLVLIFQPMFLFWRKRLVIKYCCTQLHYVCCHFFKLQQVARIEKTVFLNAEKFLVSVTFV